MFMTSVLLWLTAALYAAAASLYVLHLAKGKDNVASWAGYVLGGAVLLNLGYLGSDWVHDARPVDIHQALAAMSLVVVLVFLITGRTRKRLRILGAFITPVTLLLFLGAAFRRAPETVPEPVRSAMLPVHVGVNVLGLAAFAFAFAAGAAYVIQERLLRKKNLGGVFQRLPALDVLDQIGLRSVLVGFPLLTVGVVTGTMFAVDLQTGSVGLSPAQGFGLLAWVLFAAVLLLRVAAGWRGRKAAIGTILGFLCTMLVLVGYVLRDTMRVGA